MPIFQRLQQTLPEKGVLKATKVCLQLVQKRNGPFANTFSLSRSWYLLLSMKIDVYYDRVKLTFRPSFHKEAYRYCNLQTGSLVSGFQWKVFFFKIC